MLILATTFSIWLVQSSTPPPEVVESPLRHDHDYFAVNLTATVMDTTGQPHYQLHSDYLEHFLDDNSTELRNLNFTLYQQGMPSWFLNAQQGKVSAEGKTVWLSDQVQLRRPAQLDFWALDTSEMRVYPQQQYGETDRAVEIRRPRQVINAVGMRADLKEKRLEFLKNVRSRYEPLNAP